MSELDKITPFDFEKDQDFFLLKLNAAIDRINELTEAWDSNETRITELELRMDGLVYGDPGEDGKHE